MLTPDNILEIFELRGLPSYGICLNFLPTDILLETLTIKYNREFAVMFTIDSVKHTYTLEFLLLDYQTFSTNKYQNHP